MKITLLTVGVILCIGLVASASDAPRQIRMLMNAKKSLDARQGGQEGGRRCFGAKCDCADFGLLQGFVATMGNLVASCEVSRLWRAIVTEEKKQEKFDFYEEGCKFMEEIGEDYEDDKPNDIYTCCDVQEVLVAFHCLNTYMSLAEMALARGVFEDKTGSAVETAKLVNDLEYGMKGQCNSIFKSPNCLVFGMTGNAKIATCFQEHEEESENKGKPEDESKNKEETEEESKNEGETEGKRAMTIDEQIELLLKGIMKKHI